MKSRHPNQSLQVGRCVEYWKAKIMRDWPIPLNRKLPCLDQRLSTSSVPSIGTCTLRATMWVYQPHTNASPFVKLHVCIRMEDIYHPSQLKRHRWYYGVAGRADTNPHLAHRTDECDRSTHLRARVDVSKATWSWDCDTVTNASVASAASALYMAANVQMWGWESTWLQVRPAVPVW